MKPPPNTSSPEFVSEQLDRVFAVYPSYEEYVSSQPDPQKTIDGWRFILSTVHPRDLEFVVDKIVAGDAEPTERYDTRDKLPVRIKQAAKTLRDKRIEANRSADIRSIANGPKTTNERWAIAMRWSGRCGHLARQGLISEAENKRRVDQLVAWMNSNDDPPEWMHADADAETPTPNVSGTFGR